MKLCRTCRYGRMYELDKPCIVYREECPLYQKVGDGMNREEAIKILENERDNHINGCKGVFYETRTEAIDMAIKALESISKYKDAYNKGWDDGAKATYEHLKMCEDEQDGDLISRQAVEEIINDIRDCISVEGYCAILERLKKLPSVTQKSETVTEFADRCRECGAKYGKLLKQKTGHWILDETDNSITCDKCGCLIWANDISNGEAYYCPNCGAKMIEPQESDHTCHDCKHYTSGEYDGSCGSYICEHYSNWESEDKE